MPTQDGEEYVLVVGAAGNGLAEFASAAKSRKPESRGSSAKKQKTMTSSVVPHRVFQNQNLNEMGGSHAFLRRISSRPECVSRIGDHWYAATKRRALGSILRALHSDGTKH